MNLQILKNDIQQKVFKLLKIDENEQREKFGFLLDALIFKKRRKMGFVPHSQKYKCLKYGMRKIQLAGCNDLLRSCPKCGSVMLSTKMSWIDKVLRF